MKPQEHNQQRLWVRFVSGDPLTESESRRLMLWVDDAELKEAFLDDLETDRSLRSLEALAATEERFIEDTLAHFEREQLGTPVAFHDGSRSTPARGLQRLRPLAAQLLAAAAILFVVGVEIGRWRQSEPILLTDEPFVTAVSDHSGQDQSTRIGPGLVDFPSGNTELSFDSGAKLKVEGPAQLELIDKDELVFLSGRAEATVPANLAAFVVSTPTARIVESGTTYEIRVQKSGDTSVNLIAGELSLEPGRSGQWTGQNQRLNVSTLHQAHVAVLSPTLENTPIVLEAEGSEGEFSGMIVADGHSLEYGRRDSLRAACNSLTEFIEASPDRFETAWTQATANGSSAFIRFNGQAPRRFRIDELNELDHELSLFITTGFESDGDRPQGPVDVDFGEFTIKLDELPTLESNPNGSWSTSNSFASDHDRPRIQGQGDQRGLIEGAIWVNDHKIPFQDPHELKAIIEVRTESLRDLGLTEKEHEPSSTIRRRLFFGRGDRMPHDILDSKTSRQAEQGQD